MLGKSLKALRGKRTQEEVAKKLGVSRSRYSHYENEHVQPDNDLLQKMADYYEVSVDDLLGREKKEGFSEGLTNHIIKGLVEEYNIDLTIPGEKEKLEQFIKLYSQTRKS